MWSLAERLVARFGDPRQVAEGPARGLLDEVGLDRTEAASVQRLLIEHLEPGDVVWHVGSRAGILLLVASRLVGASGEVVAFEAGAWADSIQANARANGFEQLRVRDPDGLQRALDDEESRPTWVLLREGGEQVTALRPRLEAGGYELEHLDGYLLARRRAPELVALPAEPRVSTVIPTYNRVERVQRAIASALRQTHLHQEVLIVDDGSTDGTSAVLRDRFGGAIRVLSKENGGVSQARNYGVRHATGDLVAFLDSDDTWLPDKLERQVDYLKAHARCALVLTGFVAVDSSGREIGVERRRDALPEDGSILHHVLRDPRMLPSTMMVRRDVFEALRGFDVSLPTAEDLDLHLRIARRHHVALLSDPLVRYDAGSGDRLSELSRSYADDVAVIERFVGAHHEAIPRRDREAALFRAYHRVAQGTLHQRDYLTAARFAGKAMLTTGDAGDVRRLGSLGLSALLHVGARVRRGLRRR